MPPLRPPPFPCLGASGTARVLRRGGDRSLSPGFPARPVPDQASPATAAPARKTHPEGATAYPAKGGGLPSGQARARLVPPVAGESGCRGRRSSPPGWRGRGSPPERRCPKDSAPGGRGAPQVPAQVAGGHADDPATDRGEQRETRLHGRRLSPARRVPRAARVGQAGPKRREAPDAAAPKGERNPLPPPQQTAGRTPDSPDPPEARAVPDPDRVPLPTPADPDGRDGVRRNPRKGQTAREPDRCAQALRWRAGFPGRGGARVVSGS